MKGKRVLCVFLGLGLLCAAASAQSGGDARDSVQAREFFRKGVFAYNRAAFNESILAFEKALELLPDEPVLFEWLGNAYYRSGFDDTAIRQWEYALEHHDPSDSRAILLSSRIEIVRNRRQLFPAVDQAERYVEAASFRGMNGESTVFRNPSALLPLDDGTVWLVAHGSNELVRLDVNGLVRQRANGPLNGFDRPFDIARAIDGSLYVSEQRGGRISVLDESGAWRTYIGERGRKDGQLMGPQHLCVDDDGNILVVDYGNMRVQAFSPTGEWLFSFGSARGGFPGFRSPAGIAAFEGQIYVADSIHKTIYRFDESGNYLGALAQAALFFPESLHLDGDRRLLVADTSRIVVLDPFSGVLSELGTLGNAGGRMVGAVVDRNANILVANHAANEVNVFSRIDDLSAGMYVRIERVDASMFPTVRFELRVEDRRRRPLCGLREFNFLVEEEGSAVKDLRFLGSGDLLDELSIALVVERSGAPGLDVERLAPVVEDLVRAGSAIHSLTQAGRQPVLEKPMTASALAASLARAESSANWQFDLALRLAASDVLAAGGKRAVVFLGDGNLETGALGRYTLPELASYLSNNGVVFNAVLMGTGPGAEALHYLASHTGGSVVRAFQAEGLAPLVASLQRAPVGNYAFSYTSQLDSDWGRRFLPLEVEVYLHRRSGRDASNYFAPLQ